ncbi:hypothetical protein ABEG18_08895 [Alsobacter sp. KACC 23698]|uniref:Uncharacterized protein n=1 Tax=Alsobacter sp. KACC 23698 TaxID=3149229 RepID=A0AAU7JLN8_9HYPH
MADVVTHQPILLARSSPRVQRLSRKFASRQKRTSASLLAAGSRRAKGLLKALRNARTASHPPRLGGGRHSPLLIEIGL